MWRRIVGHGGIQEDARRIYTAVPGRLRINSLSSAYVDVVIPYSPTPRTYPQRPENDDQIASTTIALPVAAVPSSQALDVEPLDPTEELPLGAAQELIDVDEAGGDVALADTGIDAAGKKAAELCAQRCQLCPR